MEKTPNNNDEHWVTTLKKGAVAVQKAVTALKTPVDPSEYIWKYGKIILNADTGLFKFGDKEIQMRPSDKVYKIVKLLVRASGNEVSYDEIIKSLGLRDQNEEKHRKSRSLVGSSIRDLRRRLGINAYKEKGKNPFIPTGKGIKLAFLPK